jgi:hypothetical protein
LNTYDVLVEFKGSYIRRLKYYSECQKIFFEKKVIFKDERVVQIMKNEDTRNYRKYGDRNTRTIFLIQTIGDQREYQVWVSDNGSPITKFISKITEEWRFLEIANSPLGLFVLYNAKLGKLTCYEIDNCNQLLYPSELDRYITSQVTGLYMDKTIRKFFLFHKKMYF